MDETWIGGKDYNRHWSKKSGGQGGAGSGKTAIVGAVERKGNVVTHFLGKVNAKAAENFVREVVSNKVSLLATDDYQFYDGLKEYPRPVRQAPRKSIRRRRGSHSKH